MSEYRLEMKDINKSFFSMQALTNANFKLKRGEAHALLGMNGAGKSTLIKILSGIYREDSGQIFIEGKETRIENAQDAMDCGIATVYQHPHLVTSFTGYENIYLGNESKKTGMLSNINREHMKKDALALVEEYHMDLDVTKQVVDMKPVEREMISILTALSRESKILILDEPTSILTKKEKETLFNVVRELKNKGVSIIFVTHRLDEVNEICDEITVFRDGKNVDSIRVGDGLDTNHIAELMLGKRLEKLYPPKSGSTVSDKVLEAKSITLGARLLGVDLSATRGEILGVFGLVGSGIDELSKVLFSAIRPTSGEIYLNGKLSKMKSPQSAIKNKIFLVPGNRQVEGYIGDQSIASNITLSKIDKVTGALGLIKEKTKRKDAKKMIEDLSIATPNEKKEVSDLSGGNQQKVVVGKGLYTEADIYIFCEPTVGVDVGARYSIYEIMRTLSEKSVVILISSDIEEVFGMSDRVMILNQGKVTMEARAEEITMNAMLVNAVSAM